MQKLRYEIDPHNRLIVKNASRKSLLPHFRKVLDGRFKTDKNNILTYHVKAPFPKGSSVPHQVKIMGKWSLDKDHNLKLTLDKWGRKTFGDKLTLKGNIISVNKNSICFSLTTRTKENTESIYTLRLLGSWQADKYNRLIFKTKKEEGKHDILMLEGAWELNKNHQVIYRYEKAHLTKKLKKVHTIVFKGYWNIRDKARMSYVIDKTTNSFFSFKTGLGIFKEKYIKYEIGVGSSKRYNVKTIKLYGRWKLRKNRTLLFEIKYENQKTRAVVFGVDAKLTAKDTLLFKIRNDLNKDLGVSLKLSRRIFKGEAFVRALKTDKESAIYAGLGRKW